MRWYQPASGHAGPNPGAGFWHPSPFLYLLLVHGLSLADCCLWKPLCPNLNLTLHCLRDSFHPSYWLGRSTFYLFSAISSPWGVDSVHWHLYWCDSSPISFLCCLPPLSSSFSFDLCILLVWDSACLKLPPTILQNGLGPVSVSIVSLVCFHPYTRTLLIWGPICFVFSY